MPKKTANQILAENLARYMGAAKLSALALSKQAGVAANTIGNYLDTEPAVTSTGKERSAKLAEVERLARALGVSVVDLLTEHSEGNLPAFTVVGEEAEFLRALGDLGPERQAEIMGAVMKEARELVAAAERLIASRRMRETAELSRSWPNQRVTIKIGDGNPKQGTLPLTTVDDPLNAAPGAREAAWYEKLEETKKPQGI
jgi:transcriptional regulator with XRE-family HTH domain